ncbi:hypothetical protein FA15DRAFT_413019 [Coprinopsis marcescibilis]|uniref:Uncharacterized protein n=1 Tax=Coprinopsis marcescibilis TaxID=230819 RepID=A0A5C3KVE4_COPMA|nr:hypothetical protein FA15DRAFT_413019 [Coprinopsis marcescibilis]
MRLCFAVRLERRGGLTLGLTFDFSCCIPLHATSEFPLSYATAGPLAEVCTFHFICTLDPSCFNSPDILPV